MCLAPVLFPLTVIEMKTEIMGYPLTETVTVTDINFITETEL